jgi:hypothetical protein
MSDRYPDRPGSKGDGGTSQEAADEMEPHVGRLQKMALDAIREAGETGLTADELADKLEVTRWTIQPRTSELRAKHLIGDSGQRRRNASGKRAIVWVDRVHLRAFEQAA